MSLQSELRKICDDSRRLVLGHTPPVVSLLSHAKGLKGYTLLATLESGWTIEKGNVDEFDHIRLVENSVLTTAILEKVNAVVLDGQVFKIQKSLASPIGATIKIWTLTFEPPTGETYP